MVPMPKNVNTFSREDMKKFLNSFDTVLCDCDGVLWLDVDVIKDSDHTVNKFIENNKSFFYVTNNNSKTREEYVEKCSKLGFRASKENIICTAYLAAQYLKDIHFNKKVYIIGSEGIAKELDKAGIEHTDIGPDLVETTLDSYIKTKLKIEPDIGAVLVGFDQHFSYPKLMKATTYLRDQDILFLATCGDETFPTVSQLTLPGTGCFVKCIEAATGRKAFILGKPNEYIKDAILKLHDLDPARTLMIGDRYNTDILFGRRCGFQTLLVLTGVTSIKDVEKFANSKDPSDHDFVPHFYINKLGDLLQYMT